jgi:hypothetical protein
MEHFVSQNPELEARCKKLQAQLDNKKYHEMVKNVDHSVSFLFSNICAKTSLIYETKVW